MSELRSFEQVSLALAFLVPGLIIAWVRSLFLTGRLPSQKEALLPYLALSLLYQGATWPLLPHLSAIAGELPSWLLHVFVGPFLVGALLGAFALAEWPRRLLGRFGPRLVHPVPTAWDWCFKRRIGGLVEVTMKDGSKVTGWLDDKTGFASSTGKDHDLFIGHVFVLNSDDSLVPAAPARSIYIAPGEIRYMVFFGQIDGDTDDNKAASDGR